MTAGVQSTVETEAAMRAVKEEQSRLAAWKRELEALEEKSRAEMESVERQRRQLNSHRQKLDQLAQQVRDKSAEIDDLVSVTGR